MSEAVDLWWSDAMTWWDQAHDTPEAVIQGIETEWWWSDHDTPPEEGAW